MAPRARLVAVVIIPVTLALITPVTVKVPPTFKFCPIPTPPATTIAPVVVLELVTVDDTVNRPVGITEPSMRNQLVPSDLNTRLDH